MADFADDVAKALHKRIRRRKLVGFGVAIALIAAALYFVTCGHGFGIGGHGTGSGVGPGARATSDAGPKRCLVRVSSNGYTVDGKTEVTREQVVTACKVAGAAEVTVTGDAREGSWTDLKAALEAAHVAIYQR